MIPIISVTLNFCSSLDQIGSHMKYVARVESGSVSKTPGKFFEHGVHGESSSDLFHSYWHRLEYSGAV